MSIFDIAHRDDSSRGWGTVFLFSVFGVVSLLMIILIVLSVVVPPAMSDLVETYTVEASKEMPVIRFTDSEKEALEVRLDEFKDGLASDDLVSSMELDEQELNILISGDDVGSKVHLGFDGGKLVAQMSIPLEGDLEIGPWRSSMEGRYINGVATLGLEIDGDLLAVDLVSFSVKGKLVPGWLRRVLQGEIDRMDWLNSDDAREVIGRLDGILIEDGRLILRPKKKYKV